MRGIAPLAAALLASAHPAAKAPSTVNAIEAQCTPAGKLDDARKQHVQIYADLSAAVRPGPDDGSGKWRQFKSEDELKAYVAKQSVPHTRASMWSAADGTTIAYIHFESDSADWSDEVEYCFRPDGSLARAVAALTNLEEQVYGHRTIWFGADGAVLHTKEKASESGGRRKPGPDLMEGLGPTVVYPTVKSLPFLAPAAPVKLAAPKRGP